MKQREYKLQFSDEVNNKFNTFFTKEKTRNYAMSVFFYILNSIDEDSGFMNTSLDYIYKKKYRANAVKKGKKFFSLAYFKKIANKLEDIGLLKSKRQGKLKFYAIKEVVNKVTEKTKDIVDKIVLRKIKNIVKGKYSKIHKDKSEEKVENIHNNIIEEPVEQSVVIETAYEMMKEANIKPGSIPFKQIIESLYIKTDKETIHSRGLYNYIKKVIHNKANNQYKFKEMLKKERQSGRNMWVTKKEEDKFKDLEKELLGW